MDDPELPAAKSEVDSHKSITEALRKAAEEQGKDGDLFKSAQSILSFLAGLVGILTASGFVIVNSYLGKFSSIHGYSISTGQYLAASIGALIFVLTVIIVILASAIFIAYRDLAHGDKLHPSLKLVYDMTYILILGNIRKPQNAFLIVLFVLLYSFIYGSVFYGLIPHYIGGGKPVPIYVIFKDAQEVSSFGFTSLPNHHDVVSGVEMLAELSDGILVYDLQQKYAAVIKNDDIVGILDTNSLTESSRLLSAAATETPTAEATAAQTKEP